MVQLCFGDSVKEMMKCAPVFGKELGGATAVVLSSAKPLKNPLEKAAFAVYRTLAAPFYKHQAQKQEARRRAEAIPVDYTPGDVLALPGCLNEGIIAGEILSDARKEWMRAWLCFAPHGGEAGTEADVEQYWQACRKDMQELLTRANAGETVRIWYDSTPGTLCGLYAAVALLENAPCKVTLVKVPETETKGAVTIRAALGEYGPGKFGGLLQYERPLPAADRRAWAGRWRSLQQENAPLRAVVDGELRSVPADFYDEIILAQAPAGKIMTAQLIGKVLAECNLGIGDRLIYRRIERLIQADRLRVAARGEGPYQDTLCRV